MSLLSPRRERKSLLDPVGSIVALFCLLNEFSSCSFTCQNRKYSIKIIFAEENVLFAPIF